MAVVMKVVVQIVAQVKEATHQVDDSGGFGIARSRLQRTDRSMHDFVDDATSQRFYGEFLICGHGTEAATNAINLGLANGFEMVLQTDDGRNHVESLQASVESVDLTIDDRLSLIRFLLAIRDVGTDRLLQIVDVVDENAVELVHLRIDVARDGDVNKEHRAVAAEGHQLFAMLGPEDEMRRAGRGNHDIGAFARVVKSAKLDRLSVEFVRQPDGAVVRAIGNKDRRGAMREQ